MSEKPKLIVFGTSNAEAFFGMSSGTNFSAHGIMNELYKPTGSPLITYLPDLLRIDLHSLSKIRPADKHEGVVINAAEAGKNMHILATQRFRPNVLERHPETVFIWPGLNDSRIASEIVGGEEVKGIYPGKLRQALADPSTAVYETSQLIYSYIDQMVAQSIEAGIKPIVGTIPPFSSRLAYEADDAKSTYLKTQGLETIKAVNELIKTAHSSGTTVLDIYQEVLDAETGLMKATLSWGEVEHRLRFENKFIFEDTPADLLHGNSRMQMIVAAMIAHTLFEKPVEVIPPEGEDILYPH